MMTKVFSDIPEYCMDGSEIYYVPETDVVHFTTSLESGYSGSSCEIELKKLITLCKKVKK